MNLKSFISHPSSFIRIIASLAIAMGAEHGLAQATTADRVKLARGSESGEVSEMTPNEVTLNKGAPGSKTIAVNQIKSIVFDGEPAELTQARVQAGNGAYAKALQLLKKVDAGQLQREFIKQDVEYYQAYCAARLALVGEGQIIDAGKSLHSFVQSNANSFHKFDAIELMGDLLMANGDFKNAAKQYSEVAKAPWPDYKMRAAVSLGRSLQAQGKHEEAVQQFDAVLSMGDDGADAEHQKLSATLGKAISVAETGNVDDAVKIIQKVIQDADPQQKELHARAYNALGTCHEKAKQVKEALFAFLHVDVLYSNVPEAHAEALSHLASLWKAVGQEERAREARETLHERYANSRWAKQAK